MKNNSKIIIALSGGLGNQMFQYAIYKWLYIKEYDVYFDTHWYSRSGLLPHECNKLFYFSIENINFIDFSLASKYIDFCKMYKLTDIHSLKLNLFHRYYIIAIYYIKHFLSKIKIKIPQKKYFRNINSLENLDSIIKNLKSNSTYYLTGKFTYYKYPNEINIILKKDFAFNYSLPIEITNILNEIKEKESVAIHIRRNDYVGDIKRDICSMTYYRNSIEYLFTKYKNLFFYIFSDDYEFCNNNLFFLDNYKIINNNTYDLSDYYDLLLMSNTKHLILSNSTFSWWAAWLNNNYNKTVIVPERYHFDNSWVSPEEIYPSEWIKLAIN